MPSVPHSAPPSLSHIDTQLLADLQATSINSINGKDRLSPAFLSDHSGPETTIPERQPPSPSPRLARPATWGSSWGVVTLGRGFNWNHKQGSSDSFKPDILRETSPAPDNGDDDPEWGLPPHIKRKLQALRTSSLTPTEHHAQSPQPQAGVGSTCLTASPLAEKSLNPLVTSVPSSPKLTPTTPRPVMSRSSSIHSSRRRFSGKRVSLIAGQLSMIDIEPPSPPPLQTRSPSIRGPRLPRFGSTSSFVSVQSVATPPDEYRETYLGERSIDEFVIEEEIGRGAYGLVKQAREIQEDGTFGPSVIVKQIIKSRILADCWKKHPKFGTIPIEIYVMSAISSATYTLPAPRPWHYARFGGDSNWIEGSSVHGHPNICPLLEFFEDHHFYYLILPYTIPEMIPDHGDFGDPPPKDLFDLVEAYPQGLPPALIRSYLGQIADALSFLHMKGIVHRDIKDENVILGPYSGKCTLIDFGSSGVVRKNGWDTFSGTLDYAGPEILRGERYFGKEQDVWAFGVVAFVLLVGECPFVTPEEAQEGIESPIAKAAIALKARCEGDHALDGEELDGGGALKDAAVLVRACLQVEVPSRPTFDKILSSRFLSGDGGW